MRYFISVGYTYQNGLLKELPGQMYDNNYRYNRYNYRANIDANLTKTTSMKLGVGGVLGKIQEPRSVVSGTGEDQNPWVIAQIWSHPFAGPGFINGVRTLIPKDMVPLGEVMRDGMFVFYGQGYNQTYDTTLNLDLDITQKLDFITPGLSVSVKGAYDNKFKLEKYVREAPSKRRLCTTNHTLTPTVRCHRPIPTTISHLSMYPAAAILRSLTRKAADADRTGIWRDVSTMTVHSATTEYPVCSFTISRVTIIRIATLICPVTT